MENVTTKMSGVLLKCRAANRCALCQLNTLDVNVSLSCLYFPSLWYLIKQEYSMCCFIPPTITTVPHSCHVLLQLGDFVTARAHPYRKKQKKQKNEAYL